MQIFSYYIYIETLYLHPASLLLTLAEIIITIKSGVYGFSSLTTNWVVCKESDNTIFIIIITYLLIIINI